MSPRALLWGAFGIGVLGVLALDLGLLRRSPRAVSMRDAARWTAFWVAASLAFGAGLFFSFGHRPAAEFFTAYLVEYALSVDNLFVFLVIFASFQIVDELQHKLLFWGVLSALAMRAALILGGVALVHRFDWLLYIFGAFLVLTAVRLSWADASEAQTGENAIVRFSRRLLPLAPGDHEGHFLRRGNGAVRPTTLFLVLIAIETADLLFAVDSIPAVLGVSKDGFIVYTSNAFAILGLRSLFFLLAALLPRLRYLKVALSGVLLFVGVKMLWETWRHKQAPVGISLAVVAGMLLASALASLSIPGRRA